MRLIVLHKIVIVAAAALAVIMAVWSARRYARDGQIVSLLVCAVGVLVAVGLVFYFRAIGRRYEEMEHRHRAGPGRPG